MGEHSLGFYTQPKGEQFYIPPALDQTRMQTGGTPESVKHYFETLSFTDFSLLLNGLNAYFRRISGSHTMDGQGLLSDGYMPPSPEDRISLLKEAFEKAVQKDSPEKCATILGMTILAIHPYQEGNGRTSRTIFALLVNGYSGSKEDKALFSAIGQKDNEDPENSYHSSGSHIIDLDPTNVKVGDYVLADLIGGEMKMTALTSRFGEPISRYPVRVGFSNNDRKYNSESQLSEGEQNELVKMFASNTLAFVACINSFSDELYEMSLRHINFEGTETIVIAYRNIIKSITSNDLTKLRSSFRQASFDYVRRIMDVTDRDDCQIIFSQYFEKIKKWKKENTL